MNVTVENLGPCKKLVRVEVDAQTVDAAIETTSRQFQRQASLPGFRPGKAPKEMIVKRFEQDILNETKQRLINENYRAAVKEQNLSVITDPDVEDIQFGRSLPLQFAFTVETAPEFELPDYKGLPATRETTTVTEADVEKALGYLQNEKREFKVVDRSVQKQDVAVINYLGTVEGKPITELAPANKGLSENKAFWVQVSDEQFIPGFTQQLLGLKAGDKQSVTVTFPPDFVAKELSGKQGVYEVEVVEVREPNLPALDDAFAKSYGAEDLTKLRAGVRRDLENELEFKKNNAIREQVVTTLLSRVTCDLPESAVGDETRNVVYDLVSENKRRGIATEVFEKEKDQIYAYASANARERVKSAFVLQRVAEKEKIQVTQEEIFQRVIAMAAQYNMPVEKFVKELKNKQGFGQIAQQLLISKVINFLVANAIIADVPPAPTPTPAAPTA